MIANKKPFIIGIALAISFGIVLGIMFSPVFGGGNALEAADTLYNSISKGSVSHYIVSAREESAAFNGSSVAVELAMASEEEARQTALLFKAAGAQATATADALEVSGDLGKILGNCLDDARAMYNNDGAAVASKYGYEEKRVLYNWWQAFKEMDDALKKQKKFEEAKITTHVRKRAVEMTYNYYGIEPENISDKMPVVGFSLVFYVIYTLWYGFAIMYLFEGWGLKLDH